MAGLKLIPFILLFHHITASTLHELGAFPDWTLPRLSRGSDLAPPQAGAAPLPGCPCGLTGRRARIVGGSVAGPYQHPWQVGLLAPGWRRPFCGGALIGPRWALTAAHCVTSGGDGLRVLLGGRRTDRTELTADVVRAVVHPNYTAADRSGFDFALLELASPLRLSAAGRVVPVCLPSDAAEQYVGRPALVSGWGYTREGGPPSPLLCQVGVKILPNEVCRERYPAVNAAMLCADGGGGRDSCQGDSGGPLTVLEGGRRVLVGVVSYGVGCGRPGFPGVYGRVTRALDWIGATTGGHGGCQPWVPPSLARPPFYPDWLHHRAGGQRTRQP